MWFYEVSSTLRNGSKLNSANLAMTVSKTFLLLLETDLVLKLLCDIVKFLKVIKETNDRYTEWEENQSFGVDVFIKPCHPFQDCSCQEHSVPSLFLFCALCGSDFHNAFACPRQDCSCAVHHPWRQESLLRLCPPYDSYLREVIYAYASFDLPHPSSIPSASILLRASRGKQLISCFIFLRASNRSWRAWRHEWTNSSNLPAVPQSFTTEIPETLKRHFPSLGHTSLRVFWTWTTFAHLERLANWTIPVSPLLCHQNPEVMHHHWIRESNLRVLHCNCIVLTWRPCASINLNSCDCDAWICVNTLFFLGVSRRNCNSDQRRAGMEKLCYSFASAWRYTARWDQRRWSQPWFHGKLGRLFLRQSQGRSWIAHKTLGLRHLTRNQCLRFFQR